MKNTRRSRRPSDLTMATMRIVIIYFVVGTLWTTGGDLAADSLFHDTALLSLVLSIKGWVFVLVTSILLYTLIRWGLNILSRSDQALAASENRYRQMFEQNQAVQMIIDPSDGSIISANEAACRYYGYPADQLAAKKITDINILAPDRIIEDLKKAAAGQKSNSLFRHRLASGDLRDVEVYCSPIVENGRMLLYSIVHDITARATAEDMLRRRNAELDALYETTLGLIDRLDPNSLLDVIVARAASLLEIPHAYLYVVEETDDSEPQLILRAGVGFFQSRIGDRMRRGEGLCGRVWDTRNIVIVNDYSSWPWRRTGLEAPQHATVGIPLFVQSEIVGVIGIASFVQGRTIDAEELTLLERFGKVASLALENARLYASVQQELAERKQAEEALSASEGRYRMIMEHASEGILITDQSGALLEVNGASCEMFGYDRVELMRKNLWELPLPEDLAAHPPAHEAVLRGQAVIRERPALRKDGSSFPVETTSKLLPDGRVLVITRDITARKAYEQQMQEHAAEQTRLLTQLLTAQEAERRRLSMELHDGPLQSLGVSLLAIDRVVRRYERGEHELAMDELNSAREILLGIVGEVRAVLSELSLEVLKSYGLASALRDHIERFSEVTSIEVGLHTVVEERLPAYVELLMYRLAQESLANVRKHSGATGAEITFSLEDNKLTMAISDNGTGFEAGEVLQRPRAGEQIGLLSMRQRIHDAQGDMAIESAPGNGTTLTFWCPLPSD